MWGKEPQCIITDQDIAMRNTISNVVSLNIDIVLGRVYLKQIREACGL